MHIEVPRTVEITPCVLFFIDGLRYGIDKKNGGTRVTPSVLLKSDAAGVIDVTYSSQSIAPSHISMGHP